ncbi:hypothetical protein KEM56_007157 [Ascosphaera pollenicola]|nr:hypothetical protein KEM56_007157 [Ascosphaera pollenicola]
MASHVVVIDSSARRATVKVTPSKHLSDVLSEACTKLGVDASQYGLKHKNKQLDLALSIRLSGLTSGAKLELVQNSRSPSVVSVALQLPECESQGAPNGRLIDKFPSNTTVWTVLRKFEAGVAGNDRQRNLTARAAPSTTTTTTTTNTASGSGRLFYEMPVINIMGRELNQFTDLQKTLGQLGYNGGSILLRLAFRLTDQPLEDAMQDITKYFHSVAEDTPRSEPTKMSQDAVVEQNTSDPAIIDSETNPTAAEEATDNVLESDQSLPKTKEEPVTDEDKNRTPTTEISSRQTIVYAPPTSAIPQAVRSGYDENDYTPTIDHAKAHQRNLKAAGRPNRLASDAELASQKEATEAKLAAIQSIEVKVRFPDQSQVVSNFTREDSGADLFAYVRSCLDTPFSGSKFHLTFLPPNTTSKGLKAGLSSHMVIPNSTENLLIRDLHMMGRVLVNFSWDADTPDNGRINVLKPELRAVAGQIKVQEPEAVPVDEESSQKRKGDDELKSTTKSSNSGMKKIPKWLKLPGRK